jgi:nicotinamide mononucleotide transporter
MRAAEAVAVAASLAYTLLLSYGNILAWPFALLASVVFFELTRRRQLYAEAALHIFYFLMALWGWWQWSQPALAAPHIGALHHLFIAVGCAAAIWALGRWLTTRTHAALPYLDAFTTVAALPATLLMVWAVPENWLYWIVIDAASIALYLQRDLKLSAALYALYTLLAINGYWQWTIQGLS